MRKPKKPMDKAIEQSKQLTVLLRSIKNGEYNLNDSNT